MLSYLPSPVHNYLGPILTLQLGTFGYSLNVAAYLYVSPAKHTLGIVTDSYCL